MYKPNRYKRIVMIDGVQFTYHSNNARLTNLPIWEILINEQTGERINDLRTCCIRGMHLNLKPRTNTNGFNLLANGSLSMWFNCGINNAFEFSFINLCDSINSLTSALTVSPENCFLHGLEIGLNMALPYSPLRIIKNVVCYKGKAFKQIDTRKAKLGMSAMLTDYEVKLYDKGNQSRTGGNVLRFEIHLHKMRMIKDYNICTLADLQNAEKVFKLKTFLLEALDGIIWTDKNVKLSALTNREQKQWLAISNPEYWQDLNKRKAYRERRTANNLIAKYGTIDNLQPYINECWQRAFCGIFEANKTGLFHRQNFENEAQQNGTISQLEYRGKKSHILTSNSSIEKATFLENLKEKETKNKALKKCAKSGTNNNDFKKVHLCISCKKDISNQRRNSKFCSERLHGKQAKQCRNKNSNRKRDLKKTIEKALLKNVYLAITYNDEHGNSYTDTLHPTELNILPNSWEMIKSIAPRPT